MVVIGSLAWLAAERANLLQTTPGYVTLMGALVFILSDSMLVVNRYKQYKQSFPLANGFILASYCIAQSCIVYGIE